MFAGVPGWNPDTGISLTCRDENLNKTNVTRRYRKELSWTSVSFQKPGFFSLLARVACA